MLSVPAPENEFSAQTVLTDFLAGKLRGRPVPAAYRHLVPSQVHRLDYFTSGVFCLAMNPLARRRLIEQLQKHTMRREYVAYAEGRVAQPKGTWRNWLKMSADEKQQLVISAAEARQATDDSVEEAITHYDVLAKFPLPAGRGVVTKLHVQLETGRRHQIRVQAAHAGVPLVGDRTYNLKAGKITFDRQALHAERLTLEHPDRPGKPMSWTAPLPPDLVELERMLRGAP
jgi:23S rRNA pseudouridine1911/1915/1917 synthase